MKKALSTALILGALYGTANAAPITSPLYLPSAGQITSTTKLGYTTASFDKSPEGVSDKLEDGVYLDLDGKIGVNNSLSINYGFTIDFGKKLLDEKQSALYFSDYYFGMTTRIMDYGSQKFDFILNIGQEESPIFPLNQFYGELELRYGIDLDSYNLGIVVGGTYLGNNESGEGDSVIKLERGYLVSFKLENEFIFTPDFTVGFDLYLNLNDKIKYTNGSDDKIEFGTYEEYGFNLDANIAMSQNHYLGAYFNMFLSTLEGPKNAEAKLKDPIGYDFGLKYTSQF